MRLNMVGQATGTMQQATVEQPVITACCDPAIAYCLLPIAFFRAEYCHASSADCDPVCF
jgi:hypothetical protein